MERLALIGVSHRRGGASALESWQSSFEPKILNELNGLGFSEWVPLITCNRWDLVVALPEEVNIEQARQKLIPAGQDIKPYAYLGDGALEQITRIAASLDSLNPGEDQIMKQVREAFVEARVAGSTGPLTSFAFHTALRIAKKVRREVALAPMNTSLFSLARPELEQHLPPKATIAILGAGEIGTLAAKTLSEKAGVKLMIVNRSPKRAQLLAESLGADSLSLSDFLAQPPRLDALICATPVKRLVDEKLLDKLPALKIVVDLGIPRNIEAEAARRRNLPVLDVDSLQLAGYQRREELISKLAEAEDLVQKELELALSEWTERQLGPSIKKLRDWYLETIGDDLPPEEAARLAHKFAHVPVKGLRALAREHGLEAAKTFLAETGLL